MSRQRRQVALSLVFLGSILNSCSQTDFDPAPTTLSLPSPESLGIQETPKAAQVLYAGGAGETARALAMYEKRVTDTGVHHFEIVKELGLNLLQRGIQSREPEEQLMAVFGASISLSDDLVPLLGKAIRSPFPEIQLAALAALSRFHHDHADELLNEASRSNYPLIRLEACHALAQRGAKNALGQIDALTGKIDPEARPLFASLYAMVDHPQAVERLGRLLHDPWERVRIAALLAAARHGREELLPHVRAMAVQVNVPQQEACAMALGTFKDQESLPSLKKWASSSQDHVALAAALALCRMGDDSYFPVVERLARRDNPFAVAALMDFHEGKSLLQQLLDHPNLQVRANAAIALLELGDPSCLPHLKELLVKDPRDMALMPQESPGMALTAWKITPSASQHSRQYPLLKEMSIRSREQLLARATALPLPEFLKLAELLVVSQEKALLPTLSQILSSRPEPEVISFLKRHVNDPGAPLVRNYCNLALARLHEPGPYRERLREWVLRQRKRRLIELRPLLPWQVTQQPQTMELTPEEKSRLLVESVETLASFRDKEGVQTLLDLMRDGNELNRYAIAGLLVRAIE